MTPRCAVPGCGAPLSRQSRAGVCRTHCHQPGFCQCRKCRRVEMRCGKIVALAEQGLSRAEIAARLGVSVVQLGRDIKARGLVLPAPPVAGERICRVPGCGARVAPARAGGVCRDHLHARGACECQMCHRRDRDLDALEACIVADMDRGAAARETGLGMWRVTYLARRHGLVFRDARRMPRPDRVMPRPDRVRLAVPPAPLRVADPLSPVWHPKWTPADDLWLLRARAKGRCFTHVAQDMGRARIEVEQRWHRLRAVRGVEDRLERRVGALGPRARAPWPDPACEAPS